MRRYWVVFCAILALFLLLFALAEWLKIPLLTDPMPRLKQAGLPAGLLGVALLVADVFLPVPSSLIMIANGYLFGVIVGGSLSLVGSLGATMTGFVIGRWGGRRLNRFVGFEAQRRADLLLERWGALAILVTRPIPLLAETVAVMAGASSLRWRRVLLAAFAGALPGALLYAQAGAAIVEGDEGALVFLIVLLLACAFWLVGYLMEKRLRSERR